MKNTIHEIFSEFIIADKKFHNDEIPIQEAIETLDSCLSKALELEEERVNLLTGYRLYQVSYMQDRLDEIKEDLFGYIN